MQSLIHTLAVVDGQATGEKGGSVLVWARNRLEYSPVLSLSRRVYFMHVAIKEIQRAELRGKQQEKILRNQCI